MTLPPGIEAARGHRPLLADYILALFPIFWGLHVLWFPQHALTSDPSYRWIVLGPWIMAVIAVLIGSTQISAAISKVNWLRRIGALLGAAMFINLTIKTFQATEGPPGSAIDAAVAIGNCILFLWYPL